MRTKNPKVSIIVPVYNVEKYLEECLNSILKQTLRDIEIIIADDGEHDKCREIIDRYERLDNRIVTVHEHKNGYGARVNRCIDLAHGEYIGIVEPDDFIKPSMYASLYRYAHALDADVVKSSFIERHEKEDGELIFESRYFAFDYLSKNTPHNKTYSIMDYPCEIAFHPSIWNGLYKTSYLKEKGIRFVEADGAAYVDHKFRLDVYLNTDKIAWLNIAKYHWRVASENSSNRNFNVTAALQRFQEVHDLLNKLNDEKKECLSRYVIIEEYRNTLGHVYDKEFTNDQYQILKKNLDFYSYDTIQNTPFLNSEEKTNMVNYKQNSIEFIFRIRMKKERGIPHLMEKTIGANPSISILISCHADTEFVKNECLFPIQVGAALTDKRFDGMLYDSNGINISTKNKSYCELTAQYWAWKNLDSDYYGFCHYRRYFDFKTEHTSENVWGITETQGINEESIEKYGWDEDSIRRCVDGFDVITAPIIYTPETIYEQYAKAFETDKVDLKIENVDCVLDIIREKYPDYYPYAERFFNGHIWCWANMYILKKKIFFDYCQWLFDILGEFEKRTNMSSYSMQCLRTPGHLSERLFNVYLMYILDHNPSLRWKSIFRVDIKNTMKQETLKPAFNANNIAIAISSSDYYSPITSVLLESIRANSSPNNNYDILMMDGQISDSHKEMMASIFSSAQNFSLRFLDSYRLLQKYKLKPKTGYTVDTYARLLLPELMKNFDKVIYLDADTVVNADLAELFSVDLGDKLIGGVQDIRMAMWYGMPNSCQKTILDNQLNMKNPYDYFQCGVLLFNLKQFRKEFTVEYLFDAATSQYWDCLDQDVLNYLCQEKTLHLDMAWNVMIKWPVQPSESFAPAFMYNAYVKAHKEPKIIHYAGAYPTRLIPCFTADVDMEEYFWKYARNTPFYEKLLNMRMETAIGRLKEEKLAVKIDCPVKESFKQKVKRKFVIPIVDMLLPKGSNRRHKVKKAYFKLRGWKC